MDYLSIIQEIFQKIREEQDDEYWLDILCSGDEPDFGENFPAENWEAQSNLEKTDKVQDNDDDLAF